MSNTADQVQINSSTWYPITRFNAHHRFSVNHVIGWNQTWNRRPLPIMQGRWGDQVTLPSPQSYMPHHVGGMAGGIRGGWKLNSERETNLWNYGIIGIGLKRHLRPRLLLWHSGKANNTSRVPQCQLWWQSHTMLTWCHWSCQERCSTSVNNSHRRSSGCSCSNRSSRHNENTIRKNKSTALSWAYILRPPVH